MLLSINNNTIQQITQPIAQVKHVSDFVAQGQFEYSIVATIIAFFGFGIAATAGILMRRTVKNNQTSNFDTISSQLEQILTDVLVSYYDNVASFDKKAFLALPIAFDNATTRLILKKQIMQLRRNLDGEVAQLLGKIYILAGFEAETLVNIKHKNPILRAEAIEELSFMNNSNNMINFASLINDDNDNVRLSAIKALILRGGSWTEILADYKYNLTAWQNTQLHNVIGASNDLLMPNLSPLLTSKNNAIVLLGLNIAKHFGVEAENALVVRLMQSTNADVKALAVALHKEVIYTVPVREEAYRMAA